MALTLSAARADDIDNLVSGLAKRDDDAHQRPREHCGGARASSSGIKQSMATINKAKTEISQTNDDLNFQNSNLRNLRTQENDLQNEVAELNQKFKDQAKLQDTIKQTQTELTNKNKELNAAGAAVTALKNQNVPASDSRMQQAVTENEYAFEPGRRLAKQGPYRRRSVQGGRTRSVPSEERGAGAGECRQGDRRGGQEQARRHQGQRPTSTIATARNDITARAAIVQTAGIASYTAVVTSKTPAAVPAAGAAPAPGGLAIPSIGPEVPRESLPAEAVT